MSKAKHCVWYSICLMSCFFAAAAAAEENSARRYLLPDHGSIQFNVPKSWKDSVQQPPSIVPPTITFEQKAGASFQVLVNPIWAAKKDTPPPSAIAIQQQVQRAAESVQSQAVEKSIKVTELDRSSGPGYYFSATDRSPGPGEYKYLTKGIVVVGDLAVTFTVLTNDGQVNIVNDALEMLRSAVHMTSNAK